LLFNSILSTDEVYGVTDADFEPIDNEDDPNLFVEGENFDSRIKKITN
jgi:hypothetical protein